MPVVCLCRRMAGLKPNRNGSRARSWDVHRLLSVTMERHKAISKRDSSLHNAKDSEIMPRLRSRILVKRFASTYFRRSHLCAAQTLICLKLPIFCVKPNL